MVSYTDNAISDSNNAGDNQVYIFRLFVTGASPISIRAINNLKKILEENLRDRYELDIVDVHQQPQLVQSEDVVAVPMLIKKFPSPVRRLVGDMSNTERVLSGIGLT